MTFLLTDVESSTRAWEADAATTATAIARHEEILAAANWPHRSPAADLSTADGAR